MLVYGTAYRNESRKLRIIVLLYAFDFWVILWEKKSETALLNSLGDVNVTVRTIIRRQIRVVVPGRSEIVVSVGVPSLQLCVTVMQPLTQTNSCVCTFTLRNLLYCTVEHLYVGGGDSSVVRAPDS